VYPAQVTFSVKLVAFSVKMKGKESKTEAVAYISEGNFPYRCLKCFEQEQAPSQPTFSITRIITYFQK